MALHFSLLADMQQQGYHHLGSLLTMPCLSVGITCLLHRGGRLTMPSAHPPGGLCLRSFGCSHTDIALDINVVLKLAHSSLPGMAAQDDRAYVYQAAAAQLCGPRLTCCAPVTQPDPHLNSSNTDLSGMLLAASPQGCSLSMRFSLHLPAPGN